MIHFLLGIIISIIFLYTSLSIKDLDKASQKVFFALMNNNLKIARKNLSLIVSRDTENLNEQEIIRATVETIAENTVDGVFSPLFYMFGGGPLLVMLFKAISTMDSMVGYKNERYIKFGWTAAKLDDLANYIPARLSLILIPIASLLIGKNGKKSFKVCYRDCMKSPSPNSGWSEAAFAGALGIQLGGMNYYQKIQSFKPLLGEPDKPLHVNHIKESMQLCYIASWLMLFLGIIIVLGIKFLYLNCSF